MDKPNIVFYFSDQQRWDTVRREVTPFLCKLKEEGTDFSNTFTCQPVCGPARACLQTGVYQNEHGCYANAIPLKEDAITIAKILNEAGYQTAYVGKWHLASGRFPNETHVETKAVPQALRGGYRDEWMAADVLEFTSDGNNGGYVFNKNNEKVEWKGVRADAINEFAIDFLKKRDKQKPYFLFVSQLEPHHQNSTDTFECPSGKGNAFKDIPLPHDIAGEKGNGKKAYPDYLALCERLDRNVSKMVKLLKEWGEWENTVFIYTSDHGCHFKVHNAEYKRSAHEGSTHIPLIICGAPFKIRQYSGLVSLIDLPATVLDLAGVNIPEHFKGKSLLKMLQGKEEREAVLMQISESQLARAIRTKRYKYAVRKPRSLGLVSCGAKTYREDLLFDLQTDPYEKNNLIKNKKYEAVRKELRQILTDEMVAAGEHAPIIKKKLF